MKQAALIIYLMFGSICYGEELLNPYCSKRGYCYEYSHLQEPINGLPPYSEMILAPECYINIYRCGWKKSIQPLTISGAGYTGDTLTLPADMYKTICISHLGHTRCADSLLLWELISTMEETK